MKNLLPALLVCVGLVSCAQITPYRTELKPPNKYCVADESPTECGNDTIFLAGWSKGDIPIAIVEFDDQGALQNRPFKEKIVERIDTMTEEHGTLTVVFAEKSQQMNPYYNVIVDDAIISGHGGIWEPDLFMEFISRFVAVQDAEPCTSSAASVCQ